MKVGYMTGVLMGDAKVNVEEDVSYRPKDTFDEESQEDIELKDGVEESTEEKDGSFSFLNTNMIIYVVLGLVLFKAFKK